MAVHAVTSRYAVHLLSLEGVAFWPRLLGLTSAGPNERIKMKRDGRVGGRGVGGGGG